MDKNPTYVNVKTVNYDNREWLIRHSLIISLIAILGIVTGLFLLDLPIAFFFKTPEMEIVYKISRELTNVGWSIHYFVLALLGILASFTFLKTNKALRYWSVFLLGTMIIIGLAIQVIKVIFGRQRPHSAVDFQNFNFQPFTLDPHWHSFPSGHTQVLFTVATVFLLMRPSWKWPLLILAAALSFTRVTTFQHFFSDYVAGAAIGYLGTLWLYQLWPARK